MKKILIILLSFTIIVGLCACESEKPNDNKDKANENIENIQKETEDEKEEKKGRK